MSSLVVRRTALAASTAALVLLATACGGSSDSADEKAGDTGATQADKTPSAAPAKALTAAELEKAALVQADVKHGKVATEVPAVDDIAQDKVKADDETCAPLAHLQAGSYVGKPAATAKRSWLDDMKRPAKNASTEEALLIGIDRAKVIETLASYDDGGAEQVMKDLNTAAEKCAGGFAYTAAGTKTKMAKVETTQAPEGADEAFAVTQTLNADDVKAPTKGVVVRKGATLVYFTSANLASAATGKDYDFPAELVEAQLAKLG
ncbi:hypothetical protein ACWEQU_09380 [Streptomyces nodosus]